MKLRILLAMIAAVLLVPALSAQTAIPQAPGFDGIKSKAAKGTSGLFGSEVDNVQDVNDFGSVEFTKGFGYLAAGTELTDTGIGFATKLGGLFLGLTYDGNIWSGSSTSLKTDGKENDSFPGWTISDIDGRITFDNWFNILVGNEAIGGIKVTFALNDFRTEARVDKYDDPVIVPATNDKLVDTDGDILAGLTYGRNFALGGGTLKPEISLGASFNNNSVEATKAGVGNFFGKTSKFTRNSNGSHFTNLFVKVGADYVFAPNGNVTSTLKAYYALRVDLAPEFTTKATNWTVVDATDPIGDLLGVVPGTEVESVKKVDTDTWITHNLKVHFKKSYAIDERWSAAWLAGGVLGFGSREQKAKSYTYKFFGDDTKYDVYAPVNQETFPGWHPEDQKKPITTSVFNINPQAAAAFKYNFASKPFSLFAGIGLSTAFQIQTVEQSRQSGGARNSNDKYVKDETTTLTATGLTTNFGLGGTLKPTESFAIDMLLSNNSGTNFDNNFNFGFNATDIVIEFLASLKI
jgi:hypothetical protein